MLDIPTPSVGFSPEMLLHELKERFPREPYYGPTIHNDIIRFEEGKQYIIAWIEQRLNRED